MKIQKSLLMLTAALCISLFAGCGSPAADSSSASSDTAEPAGITKEEAKQIALKDAGLAEGDVTFIYAETDMELGGDKFDVEFYGNDTEYDYEIDVATGNIISKDSEVEHGLASDTAPAATGDIGKEKAKQFALDAAGVNEADTSRLHVTADKEDGRSVYEVEFKLDKTEYSYEIDAATGEVISSDVDRD